jgi:hypothetical protein
MLNWLRSTGYTLSSPRIAAVQLGGAPEPWSLHDTRRTFVTGLQKLGFPLEIAEACVNHKSGTKAGVTKVYARHAYLPEKKDAFDAWARHIEVIVSGKPAKVVRRGA